MYCPICNRDTAFAVYEGIDQGMCLNCGTVLFEFSMIEEATKISRRKDRKDGDGGCAE